MPASAPPAKQASIPPSPVYMVKPELPASLKAAGVHGTVVVDWIVDEAGDVREAKVIESADPRLSTLAMEAVMKWKFTPGMKNGKPFATHLRVPISFE